MQIKLLLQPIHLMAILLPESQLAIMISLMIFVRALLPLLLISLMPCVKILGQRLRLIHLPTVMTQIFAILANNVLTLLFPLITAAIMAMRQPLLMICQPLIMQSEAWQLVIASAASRMAKPAQILMTTLAALAAIAIMF